MRLLTIVHVSLTLLIGTVVVRAGQVDWSSSAFSLHQRSGGAALDDSFVFELGAFADSFIPTATNTAEWAAHWKVAQRTPYNPATQIVAGSYVVESNAPPFAIGTRGYIWGLSMAHPGEWVLLGNPDWQWPSFGGAAPPVSWTFQNASDVVVGNVNPSGSPYFLRTGAINPTHPIPWITGADWQTRHFTAAQLGTTTADWLADPDGDGMTNLDEMAADTNPLVADAKPIVAVTLSQANTLEMTVTQAPNHVLEYSVQVSGDLENWSNDSADIIIVRRSANQLIVRDRIPHTSSQQRFIRLTVEL